MTLFMAMTFGPVLFVMLIATIMSELREIKSSYSNNIGIFQPLMAFGLSLVFISSISLIVFSCVNS